MSKNNEVENINTQIIMEELHRAFKMFNENLFNNELPEPAILIQSRGNKKLTLGWCTVEKVWKNEATHEERYEINLVAEALNRGIYPVMATLLHEMVHLYNLVCGVKDTSRGFTYHNMKFKKVAEAHGLIVDHADKIGWSVTKLQGFTMDLIDSYHFDEKVFSMGRRDLEMEGAGDRRKKKKTSSRKYICPCCGSSLRTSKDMNVLCGDCTDVSEGKIVQFIKVEEPEEIEPVEPTPPAEDIPVNIEVEEYVCKECGSITQIDKKLKNKKCAECGSSDVFKLGEEPEVIEEPAPAPIIEVDTTLDDGAGNIIPVKQGKLNIPEKPDNTGWDIERIRKILSEATDQMMALGYKGVETDNIEIEISEKFISGFAKYKEGKKITFSKNYLETAKDSEIVDTIKHEYLHHFEYKMEGMKVNHRKDFKNLCEKMGLETKVPIKNNRAMK